MSESNPLDVKYADNSVIEAAYMLCNLADVGTCVYEGDTRKRIASGELIRRLIEALRPWVGRIAEDVSDDQLALARLVAEVMVLQCAANRGELWPDGDKHEQKH